jgi:hypothetical protein
MNMYSPLTPEDEGLYGMSDWLKNNPINFTEENLCFKPVPSWNKGMPADETQRKNLSKCWKGSVRSQETREKLSWAKMGEKNPNYGKFGEDNPLYGRKATITQAVLDAREKWGEIQRNNPEHHMKKIVACPHCDRTGKMANMHRWHFNNCKLKV